CHSSVGGSARVGMQIGEELARRGHRVHLFTQTTPYGGWDESGGVNLHCSSLDPLPSAQAAELHTEWTVPELEALGGQVRRVALEEGLDILHFHYAAPFAPLGRDLNLRL